MNKRELAARMLGTAPARALMRLFGKPGLVCLTYHRIGEPDDLDPGIFSTGFAELEWQARWLKEQVRILDGSELEAFARGELTLDRPTCAITFDDGYADNLPAGELLQKLGVPATFFVTSGFIGSAQISDWDRIAYAIHHAQKRELTVAAVDGHGPWRIAIGEKEKTVYDVKKLYRAVDVPHQPRFIEALEREAGAQVSDRKNNHEMWMTWDEVRRLRQLGHTIGAHSHSHPILATLSVDQQRDELGRSKQILERELGQKIDLFAYPVGKPHCFTDETKRLVEELGYSCAFSFYGGANFANKTDRWDVKRSFVERDTTRAQFRARAFFTSLLPI
jgi:peptidoglycan/xylan/chitin deacetylase (PgdA/CDA1 family)